MQKQEEEKYQQINEEEGEDGAGDGIKSLKMTNDADNARRRSILEQTHDFYPASQHSMGVLASDQCACSFTRVLGPNKVIRIALVSHFVPERMVQKKRSARALIK